MNTDLQNLIEQEKLQMCVLHDFFVGYLDFTQGKNDEFDKSVGLCTNLNQYLGTFDGVTKTFHYDEDFRNEVSRIFKGYLGRDFGYEMGFKGRMVVVRYPFCTENEYDDLTDNNAHHTLPKRIEWVKKMIAELKPLIKD